MQIKKNSFGQNKRYKNAFLSSHELRLITVLLLIRDFYEG